jgi:hypothetical protein
VTSSTFHSGLFAEFLPPQFLLADQLWRLDQWEALCNSPFPLLGAVPLVPDVVPPVDPQQPIPAP